MKPNNLSIYPSSATYTQFVIPYVETWNESCVAPSCESARLRHFNPYPVTCKGVKTTNNPTTTRAGPDRAARAQRGAGCCRPRGLCLAGAGALPEDSEREYSTLRRLPVGVPHILRAQFERGMSRGEKAQIGGCGSAIGRCEIRYREPGGLWCSDACSTLGWCFSI